VLERFLIGDVLVHRIHHPSIPSTVILFLVLITSVRWVSALHSGFFLFECEDSLEGEVEHTNDDHEDDALLVPSLERRVHAVLPKDVSWLGGFFYFNLLTKEFFVLLEFRHFDCIIVSCSPVETFFIFEGQKDGARRLHLVQQFLVVRQMLDDVVVDFLNFCIGFALNCISTIYQMINDFSICISECDHGNLDRCIVSFLAFVTKAREVCAPVLHLVFYVESELTDLGKGTRLIKVVLLEFSEHFWIDLELDGVICCRNGRHVPINVIVRFDTLDPLRIHLYEEVEEDAEATDEETNHFS